MTCRCRHKNVRNLRRIGSSWVRACDCDDHASTADARVCDCGFWLSLGPSDETPVAYEVRTAELALIDGWYNERRFESESYGALCFMNGGTPGDDDDGGCSDSAADEWAGFLAQSIRMHGEMP